MGRKAKARKAQTQSHRETKKVQYRVRNWSQYNASLVERGSLEVWIEEDVLANWKPQTSGPRRRGGQVQYSSQAIECLLMMGSVLSLPLRQTEGFGRSVMRRLGVDVKVPDYTTLCKRKKDLKVNLSTTRRKEPLHILVDSTGLKVYGEGEWKVRKHGYSKRRTWRKLHLSVHPGTGVKTIFGGQLMARTFDRQIVEALIKCKALNITTQLGLPDSYPVPA